MPTIKTVEHRVYTLDEMIADESLKNRLLKEHCYINVSHDWWEYNKYNFETILKVIGFCNIKTQFSGFHSQGDGASFSGRYSYEKGCLTKIKNEYPAEDELFDIVQKIIDLQKLVGYKYRCTIKTSGRYCHEYTMSVFGDFEYLSQGFYEKLYSLEDKFLDAFRDLARWWYRSLNDEYDYLTSEVSIIETLRCNEFSEDGTIF